MLRVHALLGGLVIAILVNGEVPGQSQPSPSSEPPGTQTTEPPTSNQRGTDQAPFMIKILPSTDSEHKAAQEEHDRTEKAEVDRKLAFETQRIADYTFWLSAFTLTLFCAAVGQIVLFWVQLRYMQQGLKDAQITAIAARDAAAAQTSEFLATHHPKVRIKHVFFTGDIQPATPLVAAVECVNNGTTEAVITEFGIKFLVVEKDRFLPFPNPPIPRIIKDARFQLACGLTLRLPDVCNAVTLSRAEYVNIRGARPNCIASDICAIWTAPSVFALLVCAEY
jgi:hypothetical protein